MFDLQILFTIFSMLILIPIISITIFAVCICTVINNKTKMIIERKK